MHFYVKKSKHVTNFETVLWQVTTHLHRDTSTTHVQDTCFAKCLHRSGTWLAGLLYEIHTYSILVQPVPTKWTHFWYEARPTSCTLVHAYAWQRHVFHTVYTCVKTWLFVHTVVLNVKSMHFYVIFTKHTLYFDTVFTPFVHWQGLGHKYDPCARHVFRPNLPFLVHTFCNINVKSMHFYVKSYVYTLCARTLLHNTFHAADTHAS